MIYNYQLKSTLKKLDIRLFIHEVGKYRFNWHNKIEIIFVLKGTIQVFSDGQVYNLIKNDIILINPNSPHSTLAWGKGNIVLTLQFDPEYCNEFFPSFDMLKIRCICLYDTPNNKNYNRLRSSLSKIALAFSNKKKGYLFNIEANFNAIISFIIEQCEYAHLDTKRLQQETKNLDKIKNIVDYIDENYSEVITLDDIAQREYLNKYYLSHYFKKHMGINFSDYIAKVRFKNAVYELNSTNKTISDIAFDNGFPNVKSFNTYFKNNFQKTPSEYRRLFQNKLHDLRIKDNKYISTSNGVILEKLKEYAKLDNINLNQHIPSQYKINISTLDSKVPFEKFWFNTVSSPNFKTLFNITNLKTLNHIREDLGMQYLKLLLDEKFYSLDIHLSLLDDIITTLLQSGIKPFFSISTKNLKISNFISRYINKYGAKEVSKWRLTIHLPDYKNLDEISKILENITLLGIQYGLSFNGQFDQTTIAFLETLVLQCIENNICPHFFEFNTQSFISPDHALKFYQELKLLTNKISQNCKLIFNYKHLSCIANKPDSITSLYKIMGMISTGLTTYDEISSFDLLDESSNIPNFIPSEYFKNMSGVMTRNRIKKPTYYLFSLMNKLGSELIYHDKNCIITSTRRNIQVFLYNFYLDGMDGTEGDIQFDLSISDILGKYKLTSHLFNRSNGAVLRKYSDMGSPEYLTQEELKYLKDTCRPQITISQIDINGVWDLSLQMRPWEVLLICFDFISDE